MIVTEMQEIMLQHQNTIIHPNKPIKQSHHSRTLHTMSITKIVLPTLLENSSIAASGAD